MEIMNKLLKLKYEHDKEQRLTQNNNDSSGSRIDNDIGECPEITQEEAQDIIREYDLDGDERLNFDEFSKLLMDQSDAKPVRDHLDYWLE